MKKAVGLMLLAVLTAWGCAETNSGSGTMRKAAMCAMCGASVSADYFYTSSDRIDSYSNR